MEKVYFLEIGVKKLLKHKFDFNIVAMYGGMVGDHTFCINIIDKNSAYENSNVVYYPAELSIISINDIKFEVYQLTPLIVKFKPVPTLEEA